MKNQNGMGYILLIISIVVIIAILAGVIYYATNRVQEEQIETIRTNMLLIQGKVKVMYQESVIQKQEELLKGKKIVDNLENVEDEEKHDDAENAEDVKIEEDEEIQKIIEKGIINKEEENFDKYYLINQDVLNEMGLDNIVLNNEKYIVNYVTNEIIYIQYNSKNEEVVNYYKLSELKAEEEDSKNSENSENNKEDIN